MELKRLTLGAVATFFALLFAALAVPGLGDWLYPLPLVIGLALLLAGSWAYFVWTWRQPTAVDQARLDALLQASPRSAVRRIDFEDFAISWPEDLTDPVVALLQLHDVEHRFDDPVLERRRVALMEEAQRFFDVEAVNGFPHGGNRNRRYVGIYEGEFDAMITEKDHRLFALFTERQRAIHGAAGDLVSAYDALVAEAKRRRYALGAIESGPEPVALSQD